jgi:hypothetical protein
MELQAFMENYEVISLHLQKYILSSKHRNLPHGVLLHQIYTNCNIDSFTILLIILVNFLYFNFGLISQCYHFQYFLKLYNNSLNLYLCSIY